MLFRMMRIFSRMVRHYFLSTGNPRHIAHGIALGLILGLMPKTNLTAVVLLASMFALPVHLGAALLSASAFSLLGPLLDPLLHEVGWRVLQAPQWKNKLESLWNAPLVAWTALDNTVVLGAAIVGGALYLPAYACGRLVSRRWFAEASPGSALRGVAEDAGAAGEGPAIAAEADDDALAELLDSADAASIELDAALPPPKARPVRRLDATTDAAPLIVEDAARVIRIAEAEWTLPSALAAALQSSEEAAGDDAPHADGGPAPAADEPCAASQETADDGADEALAGEEQPAVLELPRRDAEAMEILNGRRAAAGYFRGA